MQRESATLRRENSLTTPGRLPGSELVERGDRGDAGLELLDGQLDGLGALLGGRLDLHLLLVGQVDADDLFLVLHGGSPVKGSVVRAERMRGDRESRVKALPGIVSAP